MSKEVGAEGRSDIFLDSGYRKLKVDFTYYVIVGWGRVLCYGGL